MSTTYLDTLSESPLILVIYLQTSLDMSGFSPWHQYWSMAELYQTVIIPFNLSMTESKIEEENQFLSTFFPIFIHEINYWKLWNNTLIIQIKNIFIKTSSQVLGPVCLEMEFLQIQQKYGNMAGTSRKGGILN